MVLPDVALNDPHVAAHNAERHAINVLQAPLVGSEKLASFHTALNNRESARVNIVCIGDSAVEGFPASTFDRSLPQLLQARLRSRLPTVGLGSKGGRGLIGVPTQGPIPAIVQPVVYVSGAFDPSNVGVPESFHGSPNRNLWYTADATGAAKVTLTTAPDATTVYLMHIKGIAGHATGGYYKINGGAAVPFSTLAGAAVFAMEPIDVNGGDVIEASCNVNGAFFIFNGWLECAGDEAQGIMVHNAGHCGYTAANWSANPVEAGGWRFALAAMQPHLLSISLGPNDGNVLGPNRTSAQFKTDMEALITNIRAGGGVLATVPILLEAKYDTSAGITTADPWQDYVNAMRELSEEDDTVAFLDHTVNMYPTTAADTFDLYDADRTHGNANGRAYSVMADTLTAALVPS